MIVGTTPIRVALDSSATPVLQNLGPGVVYLDTSDDVAVATGLQLPVGAAYEWPHDLSQSGSAIWLVATAADTDVRYLVVG